MLTWLSELGPQVQNRHRRLCKKNYIERKVTNFYMGFLLRYVKFYIAKRKALPLYFSYLKKYVDPAVLYVLLTIR
jgi:hypothetical protein